MTTNHFILKVGQGLRGSLDSAVAKMGAEVLSQGFADGSTTWAVNIIHPMKWTKERMDAATRKAMGNFSGQLTVQELDFEEPEGTADDVLRAWTKLGK